MAANAPTQTPAAQQPRPAGASDAGRSTRSSGVLAPISALPSVHGIGGFGAGARAFVDLLHDAGQAVWQILPTTQPGNPSNSPYDSHSQYAFNRWLICLDELVVDGLLTRAEVTDDRPAGLADGPVDYGAMHAWKGPLLDLAADRLLESLEHDRQMRSEVDAFQDENAAWLDDYARFMELKRRHATAATPLWSRAQWPVADRAASTADLPAEPTPYMRRIYAEQFLADRQWNRLRDHALDRGVHVMTDLPFYEGNDSVGVWKDPHLFQLDDELAIEWAGGAPPKPTAPLQDWGMPAYRVERKDEVLERFRAKIAHEARRVGPGGIVRLDHVLGAAEPFVVYAGTDPELVGTARFETLYSADEWNGLLASFPDVSFVGEDLGQMTPTRTAFMDAFASARMRVGMHPLRGREPLPPSPHFADSVASRDVMFAGGTHDYPYLRALLSERWDEPGVGDLRALLHERGYAPDPDSIDDVARGFLQFNYDSPAHLVIAQVFDLLAVGAHDGPVHERSFNVPGTAAGNWATRVPASLLEPGEQRDAFVASMRAISERASRLVG